MTKSIPPQVHRFVSNDFTLRIAAVDSTEAVQHMQRLQNAKPLAALGVGRAMTGALLMASHLKEGQEVGLLFKGNGPLGSLYAEATFEGQVRGYCPNPGFESGVVEDVLNLGKAMGFGSLTVARHQPFQKQPHQGTVAMVTGEVGDDLAHYLHQSHQIRSLIKLGVYFEPNGLVQAAGGVLVEVMPGVEESVVDQLQNNFDLSKDPVSKMIYEGAQPIDLVNPLLKGIEFTQIPHNFNIEYACPCTLDRVKRALTTLGPEGIQEMIDEGKTSDITCQVCGRGYKLQVSDLVDLKEELKKSLMH